MSPKQSRNVPSAPSAPHGYRASGSSAVPGHLRVAPSSNNHVLTVIRPAAPQSRLSKYSSLVDWAGTPTYGARPSPAALPASQQAHISNHSSLSNWAGASTHASAPPPAAALPRVNACMPKPSSALGLDTSYPAASTSSSANLSHSADQDREYWENIVVPILLKHYHKNVHPSVEERNAIAAEMGVTPQSVEDWFRNRRYRQRRAQGPGALVQSPVSKKYPYEYKRLGVEEKQRLEEEFLKDSNMRQDRRVRSVARKLGVDEKTMADWIGQSPSLASTLQDANTPLTIRCPVER